MSNLPGKLSVCAVIVARNEAQYLRFLLPFLASQQIDVAVIDNDSTDESLALYEQYADNPVIHVENLPYHGFASLVDRLGAKQVLFGKIRHDWIVHHDADEIMEHVGPGLTLRDVIGEADSQGYNAVNFDEFVFLPAPGSDYFNRDYYREMDRYFHFRPDHYGLHRAWKNIPGISNFKSGGHFLQGDDLRFSPVSHLLRHYIVLGQQHAYNKYLHRTFDPRDLAMGWQRKRLHFTVENLTLPEDNPYIFRLDHPGSRDFNRTNPSPHHFWNWER